MRAIVGAPLLAALLVVGATAGAQEDSTDGITYSGDGVDVVAVSADIEFGEILLDIQSDEGGTLMITLDTAVLVPGSDEGVTVVVDGQPAEPTLTTTDSMMEMVVQIPAGATMVILSGLADATLVAMDPEPADEHMDAMPDSAAVETMPADEHMDAMPDSEAPDSAAVETMPADEHMDAMPDSEAPDSAAVETMPTEGASTVADFVEPGTDISTYVDRYLHDGEFSAWYDQWYPDLAFHAALGITQTEYQDIVDSIMETVECPPGTERMGDMCAEMHPVCGPGTMLVDGACIPDGTAVRELPSVSAAEEFETQGEGLQIGVTAAGAFGVAVGIILFLWLPSRIRKRWITKRQAAKE